MNKNLPKELFKKITAPLTYSFGDVINFFISVFLLGFLSYILFYLIGYFYHSYLYSYNKADYFLNIPEKISKFHESEVTLANGADILEGDWDRLCLLNSHEVRLLNKTLRRTVTPKEWFFWKFRIEFIDFDNNGNILIFEKNQSIQGLSVSPVFITPTSQGCYARDQFVIEKVNSKNSFFHLNFIKGN